jgi:hypothetical protein
MPDAAIVQRYDDSLSLQARAEPRIKNKTKRMKNNILKTSGAAFVAVSLALGSLASAQTSVTTTTGGGATATTTTTSAGTISEFSPDTIVVRSETATDPIRYSYTKSTTYVDETGAPVSRELIKSGLPVTVYYVKQGDRMIANKVVVRKKTTTTTTSPGAIEEKRTTTTTTTKEKDKD